MEALGGGFGCCAGVVGGGFQLVDVAGDEDDGGAALAEELGEFFAHALGGAGEEDGLGGGLEGDWGGERRGGWRRTRPSTGNLLPREKKPMVNRVEIPTRRREAITSQKEVPSMEVVGGEELCTYEVILPTGPAPRVSLERLGA